MSLPDWREEPVGRHHDRKRFDCGQPELNAFLARFARQAHDSGASKTYVALDRQDGVTILGYYTLTPAQIDFSLAPNDIRPAGSGRHPLGGIRLARLAVVQSLQGKGLGGELLIAAARRCIIASTQIGGSLLLIDAKDAHAAQWYKSYGAVELPGMPLSLVLPYSLIIDVMARAGKPIL